MIIAKLKELVQYLSNYRYVIENKCVYMTVNQLRFIEQTIRNQYNVDIKLESLDDFGYYEQKFAKELSTYEYGQNKN